MSALFGPVFGTTAVDAVTDDRAWVRAMLSYESALAAAAAGVGLVDAAAAEVVRRACDDAGWVDVVAVGEQAASGGNPVIPLVHALRTRAGPAAAAVHVGATSQDVLDSALMLLARDACVVVEARLAAAADRCARLAVEHRSTPMVARTLLQQAVPTTFGAVTAGWAQGLDRARYGLSTVDFAVQYGGAGGTLAAVHPYGPQIRAELADALGLADAGVWHAERSRVAELAAALGIASGAVGTVATDVVLLAQTEVGEVREGGGGESSAMPHKANPAASVTARAAAAQAPGLVATVLAAMSGEHQRAAGAWHAQWLPLVSLLRCTGGSATRLTGALDGLVVDTGAMARNLAMLTGGGGDLAAAIALVDDVLGRREAQ